MKWLGRLFALFTHTRQPDLGEPIRSRQSEAEELERRARRAIDAMERQARLIAGPESR